MKKLPNQGFFRGRLLAIMGEKRNNPGDPEKSIKTGIFLAAPKE